MGDAYYYDPDDYMRAAILQGSLAMHAASVEPAIELGNDHASVRLPGSVASAVADKS